MFALEIGFRDGVSQPETIFVRRPLALIGGSDVAHVVVDDMKDLPYQIRLVRDLGRRFKCKPVATHEGAEISAFLEGTYEGETTLDLGPVKLHIIALDSDLLLRETEPPDRAGARVLRQAASTHGPLFPAVIVLGAYPVVMSFVPDQPLHVGRSKHCGLRLDSADISAKHARLGYESGEFWVEDLGSTNGTFVNQQQVAGRVNVEPGVPILLGRDITIIGVTSEDQISRAARAPTDKPQRVAAPERRYPVLVSVSEVARPARLVIPVGATVNVGRDPASDMWLGAPHISRRHCSATLTKTGNLSISDHSTNGTAYDDGILKRGDVLEANGIPRVFDFGGGVTLALCLNEEQENLFVASHGAADTFKRLQETDSGGGDGRPKRRERKKSESPVALPSGDEDQRPFASRVVRLFGSLSPLRKLFFMLFAISLVVAVMIVINLIVGVRT